MFRRTRAVALAAAALTAMVGATMPEPSLALGYNVQAVNDLTVSAATLRTRPLEQLVAERAAVETADPQQECLAEAVYHEARGEPLQGQLAVAEVVLNRAGSGRYPGTLCGVITQYRQFSFVRDGRIPTAPHFTDAWRRSVAIAQIAMENLATGPCAKAMFYHADYVAPIWRNGLNKIGVIGRHIFYD